MSTGSDWIPIFIAEASEHLLKLESGFSQAIPEPLAPSNLEELMRVAHTLKGSAQLMGFTDFARLTHLLENILKEWSAHPSSFFPKLQQIGLKILDGLSFWISHLKGECMLAEADFTAFVAAIGLKLNSTEKSGIEKILLATQPIFNAHKPGVSAQKTVASEIISKSAEDIPEAVLKISESRFNHLLGLVSELIGHHLKNAYQTRSLKRIMRDLAFFEQRLSGIFEEQTLSPGFWESDVSPQFLARMQDLQKLRQGLIALNDSLVFENLQVEPKIGELSECMKDMQLLPLDSVFMEAPRIVREVCGLTGKQVDLQVTGGNILLDKKMIEQVKASLMHILRNAVDHGIEIPTERTKLGKAEKGLITLKAFKQGNEVIIEIEDDGWGIDLEQIKKTALAGGFKSTEELSHMSETALLELVFKNGFSQNPHASEVSGRGVGLDIVKRDIEYLNGQVLLKSHKGLGTWFQIVLPLSLTVLEVELIEVAGKVVGVPFENCRYFELVSEIKEKHLGQFQFGAKWLPLHLLAQILDFEPPSSSKLMQPVPMSAAALVIEAGADLAAFVVDRIIGTETIFLKSLGDYLGKIPLVRGTAMRANGEVLVVLDSRGILDEAGKMKDECQKLSIIG